LGKVRELRGTRTSTLSVGALKLKTEQERFV